MKRLFLIVFAAFTFYSCDVDTVEPRYDPRDKVVGSYEVEEFSQTYNDITHYSIHVFKSGYYNEIYLDNFYAVGLRIHATLDYDKITIPFQVVDGYEIEGVGSVHGDELNLNYRVKDRYNNARTDFCETTAWFDY